MLLTVVIHREDKYYVALAPDVDIASQGETIEEATANLKEALELYFEDEDAIRPPLSGKPIITLIEASL
jgi:predicted RNase H-like HicB family nuclease